MSKRMGPKFRKGTRASDRGRKTTSMQRQKLRAAARVFGTAGNRTTRIARSQMNTVTAGFLGLENKFYDTSLSAMTVGNATALTGGEYDPSATSMISTPAVGDGEQNRDGKRIVITSVQVKGTIRRASVESSLAPGEDDSVFVALVQDTQSNGAQCNSEDIYKNLAAAVHTNVSPTRNLLFANRFRILKSERINMDYTTLASAAANDYATNAINREIDWYVPLQMPVNFNAGTTSSIANVIDNSLHIVAFSIQGTSQIMYNARIRFQG